MGFFETAYLAWPWAGLGAAIVLLILLFGTDLMRSRTDAGRWRDPAWLAWLPVPVYMLHVFEEYGLHVTGGEFDLVTAFVEKGVIDLFGGEFNMLIFPEVNILAVYVAFPVAAAMGRKNPVVGLMPYGFMLINGLTHVIGGFALGGAPFTNPGDFTGLLGFVPLFAWFVYVCVKEGLLDRRGFACAVVAGAAQHLGVFSVYAVNFAAGSAAAMAWVPFMSCIGIALAWALSRRGARAARKNLG